MATNGKPSGKTTTIVRKKGAKANVVVWSLLALLVLTAAVLALNVTQRFRRVVVETNQFRKVVQEGIRRQEMIVKAPARKEFSPAFLQMAFGDNPPLLERIKQALTEALGADPKIAQGDVALMLVTYRAEGELRDVAIHIFGNLVPERMPAFSSEGYWRSQLPDRFYEIGQSALALVGREVLILADRETEAKQRELIEAMINNRYQVVENYLHDPVSFIAVIPEPGLLLTDYFRPYLAAMLVKGKVSMEEFRGEMVALSFDQRRAVELAQVFSDMRMMAVGVGRVRYGNTEHAEMSLNQLARAPIVPEGPTVIGRMMLPGEAIERALPKFLQGFSKGIGRIQRGPGYPS
ncbi:MAG: hypothetical protein NZ483_03605 [Verrucomicrobiae bacterium]|nr:hypothetical protein [Verrucomicrobiae bacterium]MDW8344139.1 hypothetical protein [Verrucomicrobiae bacterium]